MYPCVLRVVSALLAFIFAAAAPAAEPAANSVDSLLERAFALDEGKSVPRDAAQAADLYRQATEAGVAVAHLRLGKMHETADGVTQDYAEARRHYQAAADLGLADARLQLAICHLEGWGGPVDRAAFVRELTIAADAGYIPAERILSSVHYLGIGTPPNPALALHWAAHAAAQNDARSQVMVGALVERGRALMNDVKLARTWYQLGAESDYTKAMQRMAATFLRPDQPTQDIALARQWLELAVSGGDTSAKFNLAMLETRAARPAEPPARIARLLQEAAAEGNFDAAEVLSLVANGRTLDAAFSYLVSIPRTQRYLARDGARFAKAVQEGGDHPPIIQRIVEPIYPLSLLMTDTSGRAMVEFIAGVDGRVEDAHVHEATHPEFGARALEAVRQWRFNPAVKNGHPVRAKMRVPVVFDLNQRLYRSIDSLLTYARRRAELLGEAVKADVREPHLGKPLSKMLRPVYEDGRPILPPSAALLALVLDATGIPKRGHILHATSPEVGPRFLKEALLARYTPADDTPLADDVTVILPLRAPNPPSTVPTPATPAIEAKP